MLAQAAIISQIFFHRGDFIPAYEFTHFPCAIEPVYITGLNETETYLHANGLYIFEDRPIYHLHPKITHFEIRRNIDDAVIGDIHIRWKTDCITEHPSTTVTTTVKQAATVSQETTKREKQVTENGSSEKPEQESMHSENQRKLYLEGIEKKVIIVNEHFDLLEDVYLKDSDGNDHSHRLTHSPFTNDQPGTYFVEIQGRVGKDEIRSLMEVEVIESPKHEDLAKRRSIPIILFGVIAGSGVIAWSALKK